MNVLVTGANGYLGRGIVDELINRGHDVTRAVSADTAIPKACALIQGDIFSADALRSVFGEFEVVVHLAWRDGFDHGSDYHLGSLSRHCDFVRKCVAENAAKLVVMGSMHEVGYHEGPVKADTPCFPMSAYGIAKNALRDYCFMQARGTDCCIQWLRGFYIVSDDKDGKSIFSKIAAAAQSGVKAFPFTSGKNRYDFLDYWEFCGLTVDVVESDAVSGIYNIASGAPETLASRVERFIQENGYDIRLDYGAYPDRPYDSPAIWGDMDATLSLIQGVRDATC